MDPSGKRVKTGTGMWGLGVVGGGEGITEHLTLCLDKRARSHLCFPK